MTGEILNRKRRTRARIAGAMCNSFDNRIATRPPICSDGPRGRAPIAFVSDAEIAQLVSVALENALAAIGQSKAETSLRMRAYYDRSAIREGMSSLPQAQATDSFIVSEYRKAIDFQNLTLDLAIEIIATINRYAKVCKRENVAVSA